MIAPATPLWAPTDVPLFICTVTTLGSVLGLLIRGIFADRTATKRANELLLQTKADRELIQAQNDHMRNEMALRLRTQTTELRNHIDQQTGAIVQKVDENTTLTAEVKSDAIAAYTEANHVNEKIAAIGLEIAGKQPAES